MLSSFEILVFVVYLCFVFSTVAAIMYFNPGKQVRETFHVEDTEETFVQAEFEEPSSESEQSESEESKESTTLRQRHVEKQEEKEVPWIEQVD